MTLRRVFHNAVSERIPPPKGGYNAYVSRLGGQANTGRHRVRNVPAMRGVSLPLL